MSAERIVAEMKYQIIAVLVICLISGIGLAAAGTLTLTIEPSLDGKGEIMATSITEAALSIYDGTFFDPEAVVIIKSGKISNVSRDNELEYMEETEKTLNLSQNESVRWGCNFNTGECSYQVVKSLNRPFNAAAITNGTARFNIRNYGYAGNPYGDAGGRYLMINNLYGDLIPTRIDDPTKDIHQFVGQKLRVSVIGNLSDPIYRIETFTKEQGYNHPAVSYSDGNYSPEVLGPYDGDIYTVLSPKTNPSFQVITLGAPRLGREHGIIDYTPTSPTHPNTSTSVNPSFSKWMSGEGSHGVDYGGNDSKCNTCHGNLDSKPARFSDITVSNGFCFRCHYGKGGVKSGFTVDAIGLGVGTPAPTTKPATVSHTPAGKIITEADDAGKTTILQINETVLVKLGEGFYDWNITVDNQTILSPVTGMAIKGVQGIYQARSPGSATLIADGEPYCRKLQPECGAADIGLIFHVNVLGEPAPTSTTAQRTPTFEVLFAISALLVAILLRRR